MNIIIKINNVDVTSSIISGSISKNDRIGGLSTLDFEIGQEIEIELGQKVEFIIDGITDFEGLTTSINRTAEIGSLRNINVSASDYALYMERFIVTERYENTNVEDIINDLVSKYAPDIFTTTNVGCKIAVKTITFDKLTLGDCLDKLSSYTNFNWYVDYDKDIHFFEKFKNIAPFEVTDYNGKYIQGSLSIKEDLSQLRNRVIIRGGEIEGSERTEMLDADGVKVYFKLANKFSSMPTVKVNGVVQNVGLDFIDNIDSFDCLWDFNGRYLRFKVAPPSGANKVSVTALPLYPIVVQVEDSESIDKYGVCEFYKEDLKIKSMEEGRQFAVSELEAYSDEIFEGSFLTNSVGLRAGQVITINSDVAGVNESFLIQRTNTVILGKNELRCEVQLATLKTIGIIDFLIGQMLIGNRIVQDRGDEVLDKNYFMSEKMTITESNLTINEPSIEENLEIEEISNVNDDEPTYVYAPYIPLSTSDVKVKGMWDLAKWE